MQDCSNKLDLILETITDGILVVDQSGRVLYANQAAKQLLEREQLVGQSLAIPIIANSREHQDINLIRRSSFAWAEMRSTPIVWENAPAFVIGLRDITARKHAEIALRESQQRFETLARLAPVGIFKCDRSGTCDFVNKRGCEIIGLENSEQPVNWLEHVCAMDREQVCQQWQRCIVEAQPFNSQFRFEHDDESVHWVIATAEAEADTPQTVFNGTFTDISELKRNEASLSQAAAVLETTHEGVVITDTECRIQMVNRAFTDITGYQPQECIGLSPSFLRSGLHDDDFYDAMWHDITHKGHWQGEIWNRRKNGEIYPQLMGISQVKDREGIITNYAAVFTDITQLKASERELQFLAHHDPLTQLPNRILFISRLQHAIDISQRQNGRLAVLMMDLDRFKAVNDTFGHPAGDELLKLVAECLTERLRATDTVCRIGGDEFVILLEKISHQEDAARISSEIISTLNETWHLSNAHEAHIGASIGIALFPEHGATTTELLQHADNALYLAKKEGRNRYKYFSEALTQAARSRIELEFQLRKVIDKGELRLFFQPMLAVDSDRIVAVEVLVHWQRETGELMPPAQFIPIAEETGLGIMIGQWVLNQSCHIARTWQDEGLPALRLSLNLSTHQLLQGDLSQCLRAALTTNALPADHLELELTENMLMSRENEAQKILQDLHELGVRLTLDDFGSGYSSLTHLKSYPLQALKIDRCFVAGLPDREDDMKVCATIIAIAKGLGLEVVAEGVDNQQQLDFLRHHACDFYQGYLCTPPLSEPAFRDFIQTYRERGGRS